MSANNNASHTPGEGSAARAPLASVLDIQVRQPAAGEVSTTGAGGEGSTTGAGGEGSETQKGKKRAAPKSKESAPKKPKPPTKTELTIQKAVDDKIAEERAGIVEEARDQAVRTMQASFDDQFDEQIGTLTQLRHEVNHAEIEDGAFPPSDDGRVHIRTTVVMWSNLQTAIAERNQLRAKVAELEAEVAREKEERGQQAAEVVELKGSVAQLAGVVAALQSSSSRIAAAAGTIGTLDPALPIDPALLTVAASAAPATAVTAASAGVGSSMQGSATPLTVVQAATAAASSTAGTPLPATKSRPRQHVQLNQAFNQDFNSALGIERGDPIPGWSGRDEDLPLRSDGTPYLRFTWRERVNDDRPNTWLDGLVAKYTGSEGARELSGTQGMTVKEVKEVVKSQWTTRRRMYTDSVKKSPTERQAAVEKRRRTTRKHTRIKNLAKAAETLKLNGPGWCAAWDPKAVPDEETTDEEGEASESDRAGAASGGNRPVTHATGNGESGGGQVEAPADHRADDQGARGAAASGAGASGLGGEGEVQSGRPVRRFVPAWMSWELYSTHRLLDAHIDKTNQSLRVKRATHKTVWREKLPGVVQPWMVDAGWKERNKELVGVLPPNGGPFDGSGPARSAGDFGTGLRLPVREADGSEIRADHRPEPPPGETASPPPEDLDRFGPEASTCTRLKELLDSLAPPQASGSRRTVGRLDPHAGASRRDAGAGGDADEDGHRTDDDRDLEGF